ncbi:MAG: hypothetical protein QGF53_04420, partial [Alphaproteobacteria bacterium]|nr:hypothetical protein [Alphaproteobacteria bacterium]
MIARAGHRLAAAAVLAAPLTIAASTLPFHTGLWYTAEPVMAALHAVSAVAALGLTLSIAGGAASLRGTLAQPLVLLPLALAVWSGIWLPAAMFPGLSWLGTPEFGQGIAWHLDLAVLIAAGMIVMRQRALRRAVGWIALVTVALTAASMAPGLGQHEFSPFMFADNVAFYGMFAAPLLLATLAPQRPAWRLAIVAFAGAVIILSGNRSAILLMSAAVPLGLIAWRLAANPARLRLLAAATTIVAPLVVTAAVWWIGAEFPESSLWSRALHLGVVGAALADSPSLLLAGGGWGHYAEWQIAHMPLEAIDLVSPPTDDGGASWDATHGQMHFQSHNFLAEGMLSAGLPGMLLAWMLPAALPLFARRRRLIEASVLGVVMAAMFAVWAPDAGAVPLIALAIASLAGPARRTPPSALAALVMAVVAVSSMAAAVVVAGDAGPAWRAAMANRDPTAQPLVAPLADHGRGDIYLATLYRSHAVDVANVLGTGEPFPHAMAARLESYAAAGDARLEQGSSLRLAIADLLVTGEAVLALAADPALAPLAEARAAGWKARLRRFLERAPGRDDMAAAYLGWAFGQGDEDAVAEIAALLLAHDAESPVGLWYSGGVMMGETATAAA